MMNLIVIYFVVDELSLYMYYVYIDKMVGKKY